VAVTLGPSAGFGRRSKSITHLERRCGAPYGASRSTHRVPDDVLREEHESTNRQEGHNRVQDRLDVTARCAGTKLTSLTVGNRDGDAAKDFMNELAGRLANRIQLTTDGRTLYTRGTTSSVARHKLSALIQR
jgi:hypothetical protein